MIDVIVETGKGLNKHFSRVQVHGFEKLTPKAARAALEIAGYYTGTVSWQQTHPSGEVTYYVTYRVYHNSARKIWDVR